MESAELKSGFFLKGGEYRIVEPLGQGGFGITYLAEQVSLGKGGGGSSWKDFLMQSGKLQQ